MQYPLVVRAQFISRPNRFVAHCLLEGQEVAAHVKNTGRCRELLVPGATVYLQDHKEGGARKTRYSLIAVEKGNLLINMDSQAPNRVVREALEQGSFRPTGEPLLWLRPEAAFGQSRFDFAFATRSVRGFLEVKGVTLEEEGTLLFPDAPTQRGVKHLEELIAAQKQGYWAGVLFLIQMERAAVFLPNERTHPAFAQALREAKRAGVRLFAYTCHTAPDRLALKSPVPIRLENEQEGGNSLWSR